jgi:stage II sporulation protein M
MCAIREREGIPTRQRFQDRDSFIWCVAVTTGVMTTGFVAACLWPQHFSAVVQPSLEKLRRLAETAGGSPLRTWLIIFWNNFTAALLMLVSGLLFGVFPVLSMWFNGVTIGYVMVEGAKGIHVPGWKLFLFGILPHGLFEVPAIVWASALGVKLGYAVLQETIRMVRSFFGYSAAPVRSAATLRGELGRIARHAPVIVGLLLLAAAVESNVTPKLIQWGLSS